MQLQRLIKAMALLVPVLFYSCQKEIDPPVAQFEVPAGTVTAGTEITFKNTSVNAASSEWDFGDGSAVVRSNEQEVKHTFTKVGLMQVKLIAKNKDGSHGVTKPVDVKAATVPVTSAEFEIQPSAECTVPCTITLINKSKNATSYAWDFGNDSTSTSSAEQIKVTYNKPAEYRITLTVKGTNPSEDTFVGMVKVNAAPSTDPKADFAVSGDKCIAPCTIDFANASLRAPQRTWNFGDGKLSTEESPKHEYTVAGSYIVFLIAENGTKKDVTKKIVTVYPRCVFTKHERDTDVVDFLAIYQYNSDRYPTRRVDTEKYSADNSVGSTITETHTYRDNTLMTISSVTNIKNNSGNYVDFITNNVSYVYNTDGLLISSSTSITSLRQLDNPGAGSTTFRSTTTYAYHPNYMVATVTTDGTVYSYSDTGVLESVKPGESNAFEKVNFSYKNYSEAFTPTQYNIRNGRIARVEYGDSYMDYSYDSRGQLIKKDFLNTKLPFRTSLIEEITYDDAQKNFKLLTPVFLGHPSYLKPTGVIIGNQTSYIRYIQEAGTRAETKDGWNVTYSGFNQQGLPTQSNLQGSNNQYEYDCR